MFRGKLDPTTGSIVFSNDDEEDKNTGGVEGIEFGTDANGRLTGGFRASASTVQGWEEQRKREADDKINERLRYMREVTPEVFETKKPDGSTVTEEDLRFEFASGKYDVNITLAEREQWDKKIREKADQEVRSSPYIIDQIGVGARDLGNTINTWVVQPAAEIIKNPLGAFKAGTDTIAKGVENVGYGIADSRVDYNDLPEIQAAREQGIIKKPKAVNVSEEEYQKSYYAYEADAKEQTNRIADIDARIAQIQAGNDRSTFAEARELLEEKGRLKRYLYSMDVYLGQKTVNRDLFGSESLVGQRRLGELVPFVGSVDKVNDTLKAKDIFEKYEKGEDLSNLEKSVMKEYMAYALDSRINYGIGSSVGSMMADIPGFAVEYAFTGGMAALGKKGAEKLAAKIGTDSVVRKVASNVIQSGIGKAIAGASVRTATGFSPRVAAQTAEYMLPYYDMVVTDEGKAEIKKLDDGDDFVKALTKAYGVTFVESITEELGAFIEKPQQLLKSALFSKATTAIAKKTGQAAAPNLVSKTLKAVGWNGLMGEVLEEEVSEFFQAPIEGRQYLDPLTTAEGRERFLTEFIGLGMFAGLGKVSSSTINSRNKIAAKYEAQGIPTTLPLEGNLKSLEWRNEAKAAIKGTPLEANAAQLESDIKTMQDILDGYQDGNSIDVAQIPNGIKTMLLQGQLPTLQTRIGESTIRKISSDIGLLPLNQDGSIDEARATANQPFVESEEASAARVPAEQSVNGKAVPANVSAPTVAGAELGVVNGVVEKSTKASNAALEKITQSQDAPEAKAQQLETLISDIESGKYTDDVAQTTAKFAKMELESVQKKISKPDNSIDFDTSVNKAPVQNANAAESAMVSQEIFPETVTQETRSKLNAKEIDTKDLPDFIQKGGQEAITSAKEDIKAGIAVFNSEKANYKTAQEFADAVTAKPQEFGSELNDTPIKQSFRDIAQLSKYQALYEQGMTDSDVAVQMYKDLSTTINSSSNDGAPAKTTPIRRFGMQADVINTTVQSRKAASMMPVQTEGAEFKSKLMERVRARLGNEAGDSVSYKRVNMAEDASRAVEFQQTYPERAVKIGLGLELAPEGILSNDIAWAAYEAAKENGQGKLATRILQSLTNRNTRYGQEIASLRGKFGDTTPEYFIREVINARMAAADNAKIVYQVGEKTDRAQGATVRVQERIKNEAEAARKAISAENIKLQSAQSIIDSLTCT